MDEGSEPRNLVTGSSGFLGSHLVEALVARGERVRVLVRTTSKIAHLESLGVELAYGDLTDVQSLRTATQGIEHVYHCAALAADWGTWEAFHTANVTGVRNLLEAGVSKFIHVSTTDVYGHPDYPADETAPYRLRGWSYGDTKIEGERLVWAYYQQHGLPIAVVRPASIYGPRSTTFVLEIVELLKSGGMAHIGRGGRPAGLAYVTNVVDLLLRAADSERSIGQAYNAADGLDVTWQQYVDRLAEILGVPSPRVVIPYRLAYLAGWAMEKTYGALRIGTRPLLTRMAAEVFGTHQGFPIDKARRELGYKPKVGFDEGMRRVEAWLHQTGSTWSHILRDASVGTAPLLWSLGDWRIARWAYHMAELGPAVFSRWLARGQSPKRHAAANSWQGIVAEIHSSWAPIICVP